MVRVSVGCLYAVLPVAEKALEGYRGYESSLCAVCSEGKRGRTEGLSPQCSPLRVQGHARTYMGYQKVGEEGVGRGVGAREGSRRDGQGAKERVGAEEEGVREGKEGIEYS